MSRVRPAEADLSQRLRQVAEYTAAYARPDLSVRDPQDTPGDPATGDTTEVPAMRIPVPRRDCRYYSRRSGSSRAFTELGFAD